MNKPYAFGRQQRSGPVIKPSKPRFDAACLINAGTRSSQQDAVLLSAPDGEDIALMILADGMGGHLGGEIASQVALTAAFAETMLQLVRYRAGRTLVPQALRSAIEKANAAVADHVASDPDLKGMGTTLVICVQAGPDLYWASVGDSPLYVYRDATLKRLNEDHSMGPQIDAMVLTGMIKAEEAATHPQRHQLVSAICGSRVSQIDCPTAPFRMQTGDRLILSSDGLQTLSDDAISRILRKYRRSDSHEVCHALMDAIVAAADPDQDNVAIAMSRLLSDTPLDIRSFADGADAAPTAFGKSRFPDDPDVEEASDLLNQALLL